MWTDDLDVVESCDIFRSLLNFDSIDSIGAHTDTDTYVYVKTPNSARNPGIVIVVLRLHLRRFLSSSSLSSS